MCSLCFFFCLQTNDRVPEKGSRRWNQKTTGRVFTIFTYQISCSSAQLYPDRRICSCCCSQTILDSLNLDLKFDLILCRCFFDCWRRLSSFLSTNHCLLFVAILCLIFLSFDSNFQFAIFLRLISSLLICCILLIEFY